jgi:hypothetical protein
MSGLISSFAEAILEIYGITYTSSTGNISYISIVLFCEIVGC